MHQRKHIRVWEMMAKIFQVLKDIREKNMEEGREGLREGERRMNE